VYFERALSVENRINNKINGMGVLLTHSFFCIYKEISVRRKRESMPRGKKFDAAEKHFEKQRIEWRQKTRDLETQLREASTKNSELIKIVQELKQENEQLKQSNKQLRKLNNVTEEEVRPMVKMSSSAGNLNSAFSLVRRWCNEQ